MTRKTSKKTEVITSNLPQIVERTRGRPSKYDSSMCDLVIRVAKNGGFHAAMQLACGISESQFYEWKKTIPEFKEAVEFADTISLAMQEDTLIKLSTGEYRGNVNAVLAILNNKWKAQYSRSASTETTEITVNNNTVNLTSSEVSQKITEKLEKFKRMGYDLEPINIIEDEDDI